MPPGEPAADFQVASYGKPDPEMLTTQHQTERKPRLRKQPDFFSVTGSNGKTHICCCCPEMRGQTNVKKPGGQPLGFLSLGIPCHLETRRVPLRFGESVWHRKSWPHLSHEFGGRGGAAGDGRSCGFQKLGSGEGHEAEPQVGFLKYFTSSFLPLQLLYYTPIIQLEYAILMNLISCRWYSLKIISPSATHLWLYRRRSTSRRDAVGLSAGSRAAKHSGEKNDVSPGFIN